MNEVEVRMMINAFLADRSILASFASTGSMANL